MAEKKEEPIEVTIGSEKYHWQVNGFQIKYNKASYNFKKKDLISLSENAKGRQEILKYILAKCPAYLQKVTASASKELKK